MPCGLWDFTGLMVSRASKSKNMCLSKTPASETCKSACLLPQSDPNRSKFPKNTKTLKISVFALSVRFHDCWHLHKTCKSMCFLQQTAAKTHKLTYLFVGACKKHKNECFLPHLPETHTHMQKNKCFRLFTALGRPKAAQESPRQPKATKSGQRAPKDGPWEPQRQPRASQSGQRDTQGRPWESQGLPKGATVTQRTPKGTPREPQRIQRDSKVSPKVACK